MSATNSFPDKKLHEALKAAGFNPSLPFALFGEGGQLLAANARMRELLGLSESAALPLPRDGAVALWPFFNEHLSAPALFQLAVQGGKDSRVLDCEARLRTYRLLTRWMPALKGLVVVAELRRQGDLLKDKASRQVLFRAMAHEIRTSVLAVRGYAGMLVDQGATGSQKELLEKMESACRRLDTVVERLSDFRAEVEGETDRAQTQGKRKKRAA